MPKYMLEAIALAIVATLTPTLLGAALAVAMMR